MKARQLFIIVPIAAMIGTAAALSLSLLVDRPNSRLSAFQVQLAKQNAARSVVNHNPTSSAPARRAQRLRDRRARAAAIRARRARAARQAGAASTAPEAGTASQSAGGTGFSPAPAQAVAPAPVSRPAPRPASRKPSGGGGSFDDSG